MNQELSQNKYVLIAQRYANALLDSAHGNSKIYDQILDDLYTVQEILDSSPELNFALTNPTISVEDKKEIIDRVFKIDIISDTKNFLKVLVEKNRFFASKNILHAYEKALNSINNVDIVDVVSAVELNSEVKDRITTKLEAKLQKTVSVNWLIEPDIIAGLIIKIGDNVIDNSVKHKMEDLSKNITK